MRYSCTAGYSPEDEGDPGTLALDGLRFHLLAQLFDDLVDVPAHRLIDYLPAVLRCKYQAIFTPVTGVPPYALPHFSFA